MDMQASHRDFELPVTAHPSLNGLLDKWKRAWEHRPPTGEDLRYDALLEEYPGLFLVDPGPKKRGRYDPVMVRLAPAVTEKVNREVDGMRFSQIIHPQMRKHVDEVYLTLMETGRPHYWEMANVIYGSSPERYHRLLLPIYGAAGKIDHLLGCCAWD